MFFFLLSSGVNAILTTKGQKLIFFPLKSIRHRSQVYVRWCLVTFFVPHFGQRRCHEIFIAYSDILELSAGCNGDGRHLEDKMQKLEELLQDSLYLWQLALSQLSQVFPTLLFTFNCLLGIKKAGISGIPGTGHEAAVYSVFGQPVRGLSR